MWDEIQHSRSGCSYRELGEGAPIVLLHGIPGSGSVWQVTAESLSSELRVIVPDLLGFAGSSRPTELYALHAQAQSAALADLLGELGVEDAVVVGHDFGGPVALALTSLRPSLVRAVGLLATNTFPDTPIPFPLAMVTWPVIGRFARQVLFSPASVRMMLRRGVGPGATSPDPGSHLGDAEQQQVIATIFAGSLTRLEEFYAPTEHQLNSLRVPVYVGWGDRDPFFSIDQGERTARAADAAYRRYPGAGHFLPHERPHEVAADIMELVTAASGKRL